MGGWIGEAGLVIDLDSTGIFSVLRGSGNFLQNSVFWGFLLLLFLK